jgi:5'-hydroxyaverantin dehydrogenase
MLCVTVATMGHPFQPVDLVGLKDKNTLILGGSSGIGLETTQLFLANGAFVTIADVQPPLENLEGQHVQHVKCDVTDWISQVEAFKKAIAFRGKGTLDAVVTFAAIDPLENVSAAITSSPCELC